MLALFICCVVNLLYYILAKVCDSGFFFPSWCVSETKGQTCKSCMCVKKGRRYTALLVMCLKKQPIPDM